MEFIDGMDIQDYLKEHGGVLPQEHALSITAHVLDALEYAHKHGIVHRDIKPANILLNKEGRVKIADFGLAKALPTAGEEEATALTMTNMAVGTPDFVAPEALDCDKIPDHRADLYAVGVMLYRMLTGKLPRGNFDSPSEMLAELDPRLDDVVARAMATDPDKRYSTASELRIALDPVISTPMSRVQMIEQEEAESRAIQIAEQQKSQALQAEQAKSRLLEKKKKESQTKLYIGVGVAALLVIGGLVAFLMSSGDKQDGSKTPVLTVTEPKPPPVKNDQPKKTTNEDKKLPETTVAKVGSPAVVEKPKSTTPIKPPEPEPTSATAPPPTEPSEADKPPEPKPSGLAAIPGLKTRLDGYLKAQSTQVGGLATKYMSGLEARLNQAADSGNLKLVEVFREEKAKVQELQQSLATHSADPVAGVANKATLPPLAADVPTDLSGLRQIWTSERQKIRSTLDVALQQSLKSLEGQLTKSRDFDNAKKVLTYRESFGAVTPAVATTPKPLKKPVGASTALASASKDKPFENSLGMRFVPVPITGGPTDGKTVLFSIWETRVKDYEAFIKKNKEREWPEPGFKQRDDHPAVCVIWDDAAAFCEWLTREDREKGKLGKDEHYRLPSYHEWSCAVGIGSKEEVPSVKDSKILEIYPWGEKFPPPKGAGNYYGEETKRNPFGDRKPIEGYNDSFDRTAPVGSFEVSKYGLYDMGGNVFEWCEDWDSTAKKKRVLRGGSWYYYTESSLRSSYRLLSTPTWRGQSYGFRCVVVGAGMEDSPQKPVAPKPLAATNTAMGIASATKDKPYENSLGMRFVPVPITGGPSDGKTVLFSIWETRVQDYKAFIKKNRKREWPKPDFEQDEDHPAVNVSWDDAVAFSEWLTQEERTKGKLGKDERYRLPTDHEWSCAVGIGKEEDADVLPSAKSEKVIDDYPWSKKTSPPRGSGNYCGEEMKANPYDKIQRVIKGYKDRFDRTAPVGSFKSNVFGLYDLSGNAIEWCQDRHTAVKNKSRVLRGGSWRDSEVSNFRSSHRTFGNSTNRFDSRGFRLVVTVVIDKLQASPTKPTPKTAPQPQSSSNVVKDIESATKDKPFENSLGMKFVPVPITGGPTDGKTVLFSIWETRVKDYSGFIKENPERKWKGSGFEQKDDHPAVNISWEDAVAFCEWLTEKSRKESKLGNGKRYRLPTDHEWSCAVGIGKEEDASTMPTEKRERGRDFDYLWGPEYPPPVGSGNFHGEEDSNFTASRNPIIAGYNDGFDQTSPVGSFDANKYGLYDLGGNVWEWCNDWMGIKQIVRTLRGESYNAGTENGLKSSRRLGNPPNRRNNTFGFRVVLAKDSD